MPPHRVEEGEGGLKFRFQVLAMTVTFGGFLTFRSPPFSHRDNAESLKHPAEARAVSAGEHPV